MQYINTRQALSLVRRVHIAPALFLVAATFMQGLLYLLLLPPWQHYDEPTHFEYAWLIANRNRLPQANDVDLEMRRAVATSMLAHNFYWNQAQPNLTATDANAIWIGVSELSHPPAYYLLVSLPLRFVRHLDVTSQLYIARSVSLGLFLVTILTVYAIVRDLTPPNHLLRWFIPVMVILLPPFTDLMTAVNNDVGAVAIFSLFLWSGVRTIRYGITVPRLLWLGLTAIVAALTKSTAAIALVLAPLSVLVAWSIRHKRLGPASLLVTAALPVLACFALFDWKDAAIWQRGYAQYQPSATRAIQQSAPVGQHVVALEAATDQEQWLLNPVLAQDVGRLAGQTVTIGGWIWADQPGPAWSPGMAWSNQGTTEFAKEATPMEASTTPQFVAQTFRVPEQAGTLFYVLIARAASDQSLPSRIFLDGAVMVPGEFPAGTAPTFADESGQTGLWAGRQFTNLVRNGSAEQAWPHIREQAQQQLVRFVRLSHLQNLTPLFDLERNGPFLFYVATHQLVHSFFARFAWGHISLPSIAPLVLFQGLMLVASLGSVVWWVRSRPLPFVRSGLLFLALAGLLVWGNALVWPLAHTYVSKVPLPAARYAFPVIVPTAFLLAGGWWGLWPRRFRLYGALALVLGMLALNALAVQTIWSFYQRLLR